MSGRGPHRRPRRAGPPRRVYRTAPYDGAPIVSHVEANSRPHAETAPGSRLGLSVDLDRMNWDAKVADTVNRSEGGLAVGRLIISDGFLADVGRLARRLNNHSVGAVALVPFGIRYTAALVPPGTEISELGLDTIYDTEPRFEEDLEVSVSMPGQKRRKDMIWVGMSLFHGETGGVDYISDESELAMGALGGGSRNVMVPARFAALFGFQAGDTNGADFAARGLMGLDRQITLGSLTTLPYANINLGPTS